MIKWIRAAKAEVMQGDAPFYLGIHVSNLVRDGILASFQADLLKSPHYTVSAP
jgi:hypothetical protein